MRNRMCLALLVFSLLAVSPAWAITRYVDNSATGCSNPDTDYTLATRACGSGSATVHTTLANALANESAGDTIAMRAGTYLEGVQGGTELSNGSAGAPTTLTNYNGESVTLRPSSGAHVIFISGTGRHHITIHGLIVDGANNTFEGIKFGDGVLNSTSNNIIIEDCEIKNSARNGVLGDGFNQTLRRLSVHNNGRTQPAAPYAHGFYYTGRDSTLDSNTVYDNWGYGIQIYASGCNGTSCPHGITLTRNVFYGNGAATSSLAQVVIGGYNNVIRNNVVRPGTVQRHGLQISSSQCGNNGPNTADNNTLYATSAQLGFTTACNNLTIRNNVVIGWGTPISGSVTSVSNRTSGTASDLFTSPPTDLSLKAGSAAINAGTSCQLAFNGSSCDQGAFESIPAPTMATATGNTVDVTLPMSTNTPVLPATGQTTWVVKFGGVARGTVSAVKKTGTDSVVQLTYDGAACANTDTMTIDYTVGTVTDSARIGNSLNQPLHALTGLAVDESGCTGGGPPPPPVGTTIIYHLNDGAGTNVTDSSGNANHGTTTGSPAWTTGLVDGALSFADLVDDYVTAPYGSGVNPTTQSMTICILVSPDSITNSRAFFGSPTGASQRAVLVAVSGTWSMGIQASSGEVNNDFPVQAGWSLPCIVWNAGTDTATLWVNAVAGTGAQSVKTYTSHTLAGNITFGNASGFGTAIAPGADIDEIFVYPTALNQSEMTELYQSLIQPTPPPSGTREQKGHQFQKPYKKANGDPEDILTLNSETTVVRGGAIDLVVQLDCTTAACPSWGPRIQRSLDGGATYAQINDVCGTICFRGVSGDTDLVSADVAACLTGALTDVSGPTNFTSAAVPSVALAEDECTVLRYKFTIDPAATVGQVIYLKVFDQNGNDLEASATPALGAKLTVTEHGAGIGF
jgi:hypothetical protein